MWQWHRSYRTEGPARSCSGRNLEKITTTDLARHRLHDDYFWSAHADYLMCLKNIIQWYTSLFYLNAGHWWARRVGEAARRAGQGRNIRRRAIKTELGWINRSNAFRTVFYGIDPRNIRGISIQVLSVFDLFATDIFILKSRNESIHYRPITSRRATPNQIMMWCDRPIISHSKFEGFDGRHRMAIPPEKLNPSSPTKTDW